jgi:hypothetical protein
MSGGQLLLFPTGKARMPPKSTSPFTDKFHEPAPTSADAFALIEVSDTTYECDREYKIPLYVAAGVPAWIVNVAQRWVEFYGSPDDLKLTNGHVFRDTFDVLGVTVAVNRLFRPS